PPYQPTPGDRVRVIALGKTATVISSAGSSGEFYVRLGSLKLAVRPEEVETPTHPPGQK
ncbi:MAG: Smr/MutS family protein, partial [Pseudanabaenaceae cyanobacterium]